MKWLIRVLLGLAALALLFAVGAAARDRYRRLAPNPDPYEAAARAYGVEILRDPYGVPHIYGQTDADVAFGLAYAHAEDDFPTIQEVLLAIRGVAAQHQGKDAAPGDFLVRWLEVWKTVEAGYETKLAPATRRLLTGYADGLNLYAARHPEELAPGLLPVRGQDIAAGFVFKTPFFYRLDRRLAELFEDERQREVVDFGAALKRRIGRKLGGFGSNGLAVTATRSGDGVTRLLVNSHQPLEGPVAWYEFRGRSEEGLDVAGGTFPGSPLMLHGHNRNLGWAATVNFPDLMDIYVLEIDEEDEARYRLDGEWRTMRSEPILIWVKLWGPFYWPARRTLWFSEHGPVLRRPHGTYAVRWVGRGEIRQVEQFLKMNRARRQSDFEAALRMQALPNLNFVYADRDGHVAMYYNAKIPLRPPGLPYETSYQPGDRSELVWDRYTDFDELPHTIDPPSGFVFNTNNAPWQATDGPGSPSADDYPEAHGIGGVEANRAQRILELTGQGEPLGRERLLGLKYDRRYPAGGTMAGLVRELLALDWRDADPVVARALEVVRAWDRSAEKDSRAAAVLVMTAEPILLARGWVEPEPDLAELFIENAHHLQDTFGRPDPEWGQVNRLRRGDVDLPVGGAPDTLRAIHGKKDDDGRLKAWLGDSFIQLVEWGPDGELHSQSVNVFGASQRPDSPHFTDQMPLFIEHRMKSVPLDRAELEGVASERARPTRTASLRDDG